MRGLQSSVALTVATLLAVADAGAPAVLAGLLGGILLADGALALTGARRSAVGADSEARVRRALDGLRADGWLIRHSVSWPGGGDIDHVARSPGGSWFAIETKTRRYGRRDLARTAATARWLGRRRRGAHAVAVLCVVRERRPAAIEHGVLVVWLGGLPDALRALAVPSGGRRARVHVRRRAFAGRAAARW